MFNYDKLNRLTQGSYARYAGGAWSTDVGIFNEGISYDLNGNISNLQRMKEVKGAQLFKFTSTLMDNLSYTYANGNQLSKVEDASIDPAGFKNGVNNTTEYTYNGAGSMLTDQNKGINSNIVYDSIINKPKKVTLSGGYILYTYDAVGNKLSKKTYKTNVLQSQNEYVGEFVYEIPP